MMEPYFDRHGMRWSAQRAYIKKNRWTILGFALPISLLLAIPIIGPLFFGIAQAGAAWFVRHVLEGAPEPGAVANPTAPGASPAALSAPGNAHVPMLGPSSPAPSPFPEPNPVQQAVQQAVPHTEAPPG
jgi:hypothetical protein